MTETYESACIRHARAQGLPEAFIPLSHIFGEQQVTLEQTGGMCMVIQVKLSTNPDYYVWITHESDDPDNPWAWGKYQVLDDENKLEDSTEVYGYASLSALPEIIAYQLNKGATK